MVTERQRHLENLSEIRQIMERSTRFLSLSGLSGVFAGASALGGAAVAFWRINYADYSDQAGRRGLSWVPYDAHAAYDLAWVGLAVLVLALASIVGFTYRNARRQGLPVWTPPTLRTLSSMVAPLTAGGLLCVAMAVNGVYVYVPSVTLVFYGLALDSASRHTHREIRGLGWVMIALGLSDALTLSYSVLFWGFGFGAMHIVYGAFMYSRYERSIEGPPVRHRA